jgi:membrane-bound inhibitor of C-type lysozyme
MCRLTILAGLILLGGCKSEEKTAAASGPQPSEAEVLAQLQNEQDAITGSIANDAGHYAAANQDAADNATAATDPGTYSCDNGMMVKAQYMPDGSAQLTIAGKRYSLASIAAASGAKYHAAAGPTPGKSISWWSKDNAAMLIEAPAGARDGAPGETSADCLAGTRIDD